jgi:hypothetical protein
MVRLLQARSERYSGRMRFALALVVLTFSTAQAITPKQVDDAARHAQNGLRSVVKKLSSKKLAGRDNATPGSLGARTYLIRQLRRLGVGASGGGKSDAAYEQALPSPDRVARTSWRSCRGATSPASTS